MAYRLKLDQPLDRSIRRIAKEQFARGEKCLVEGSDVSMAVHSARKCIKRLRSLLRFVRPALSKTDFRVMDVHLRDAGRFMSGRRDKDVLDETLASLLADPELSDRLPKDMLVKASADLSAGKSEACSAVERDAVIKSLAEGKRNFTRLTMEIASFDIVAEGVSKTYGGCQAAYGLAMVSPTVEHIHDLRKEVQRHWRHMQLLTPLWPGVFKSRVVLAREISELLGSDHDIAAAMDFIEVSGVSLLGAKGQRIVLEAAADRQFELRQRAFSRCEALLAGRSKEWRRVLPRYWRSAKRMSDEPAVVAS